MTDVPDLTAEEDEMFSALLAKKEAAARARLENAQATVEAKFAPLRAIVGTEPWTEQQAGLEAASASFGPDVQIAISRYRTCADALAVAVTKAEQSELATAAAVVEEAFPPAPPV